MNESVQPHEIDAVLDGTMPEPRATEIRNRIAEDEVLRDRYGPLFELELLAADASSHADESSDDYVSTIPRKARRSRTPRIRIAGPIIAAAALFLILVRVSSDGSRDAEAPPTDEARTASAPVFSGTSALVAASVEHSRRGPEGAVYESWHRRDDGVWIGARVEAFDDATAWRVIHRRTVPDSR